MPQVTQAEICPRLFGLLRESTNLDWIAPDNGPWSCLPLDWKYFCSPDIPRANFPAVQTKSPMQTMLYQKCKAYVCLEDFENAFFFIKQVNVCKT